MGVPRVGERKNSARGSSHALFSAAGGLLHFTLLTLALLGEARAACPDPTAALEEARQAVLALEDEKAKAAISQVEAALGCGAWVQPDQLAQLWLVVGARAALAGKDNEASDAFAAAARVSPGLWDEDLGPDLRRRYDEASGRPTQAPGEVRVNPDPAGLQVMMDGQRVSPNHLAAGGLHLLQIGPPEGPAVFARIYWLPADELLVIDTGLAPDLGAKLAAEAAARGQSKLSPALEAEAKELRRQATRDWGEIEADTRFPDARAERLLAAYVKRYGEVYVGKGGSRTRVEITQVKEAQGRLDALPEARARLDEREASEKELDRALGSERSVTRAADDQDTALLHRVDLGVGGALTHAGSGDGGDGFGGAGLRAGLGVELRVRGALGLRAELGYQGLASGPESLDVVNGVEPVGTSLGLGYGALGVAWSQGGLGAWAGPAYALGGGQVDAASAYADPTGMGLVDGAPVDTRVRAGGLLAGGRWDAVYAGPLRLSPALTLGLLTDLDRAWPTAELGLRVGWRP